MILIAIAISLAALLGDATLVESVPRSRRSRDPPIWSSRRRVPSPSGAEVVD